MGVGVLSDGEKACLFCNTADVAFGPVFSLTSDLDRLFDSLEEFGDAFIDWLPSDPRVTPDLGTWLTRFRAALQHAERCQDCPKLVPKPEGICEDCRAQIDDDEAFEEGFRQ